MTVDRSLAHRTFRRRPPRRPAPGQRARSVCTCLPFATHMYAALFSFKEDQRVMSLIGKGLHSDGYRDVTSEDGL